MKCPQCGGELDKDGCCPKCGTCQNTEERVKVKVKETKYPDLKPKGK